MQLESDFQSIVEFYEKKNLLPHSKAQTILAKALQNSWPSWAIKIVEFAKSLRSDEVKKFLQENKALINAGITLMFFYIYYNKFV